MRSVPLGRSFTDPSFLSSQIVVSVVLFHIILGLHAFLISAVALALGSSSTSHTTTTTSTVGDVGGWQLWTNLLHHLHVSTIFTPSSLSHLRFGTHQVADEVTVGDDLRFLLLHSLSAMTFSFPFSRIVQRRRFVTDFVATVYLLYTVAAMISAGGNWRVVPLNLWWLFCVFGGGCVVTLMCSMVLVKRREQADIELSSSYLAPSSPVVAVPITLPALSAPNSCSGGSGTSPSAVVNLVPIGSVSPSAGAAGSGVPPANGVGLNAAPMSNTSDHLPLLAVTNIAAARVRDSLLFGRKME
mmetsp:Transcript_8439/g.9537  ORF Transcript_8439/g.9537 Transcript_8439/m.9537 type:complete len:299 (+) Transcript_8439:20-916(+)